MKISIKINIKVQYLKIDYDAIDKTYKKRAIYKQLNAFR